ncbi:hypothetical protein [Vibrio sp. 10N.239.312.D08]|uniref:hypothetical protein n=1 Tax=Vibrio sp. 10N.239.312.D08 TaxID=3229978 RepID=UPI0035518324
MNNEIMFVKQAININIVEGAQEAISKNLLPANVCELEFSTIVEPDEDMFCSNGLNFANTLDSSLIKVIEHITVDGVKIIGDSFVSQVVGNRRQFFSGLMNYNLKKGEVEQEISLHAVFRKVN